MSAALDATVGQIMIRIIKNAMAIGASVAKRVYRSAAKTLRRPRNGGGGNDKIVILEPKLGVCINKINIRRDDTSFESKDGLDEAC